MNKLKMYKVLNSLTKQEINLLHNKFIFSGKKIKKKEMIYNLLGGGSRNLLELKSLSTKMADDTIYSILYEHKYGLFAGLLNYLNDNCNDKECVIFSLGSACWNRITSCGGPFLEERCDDQLLSPLFFEGIIKQNIISGTYTTLVIIDSKLNTYNNIDYVKNKLAYLLKHYEDEYYFFSLPDTYPDDSTLDIVNTDAYKDDSLLVLQSCEKRIRLIFYTNNLPTLPITPFNRSEYNEQQVVEFYNELKRYTDRITYRLGCVLFLNFIKFKSPKLSERQVENFIQDTLLNITENNNDIELIKLKEEGHITETPFRKLLLSWNGYVDKDSPVYNIQNLMFIPTKRVRNGISNSKQINDMQLRIPYAYPILLIPYTGNIPIYGIVTPGIFDEYNISKIMTSTSFDKNYKIGNIIIHVNKDYELEFTYTTNLI
jgi:hypothetical protein